MAVAVAGGGLQLWAGKAPIAPCWLPVFLYIHPLLGLQ